MINNLSIILPAYNGGEFITDAINSILNQRYLPKEYELLIIDDGSYDQLSIAKYVELDNKYSNIKLYNLKTNIGIAAARNYGINKAKYEYLAFIDQDDTWAINKLELQNNILKQEQYKDIDYILGYQEFYLHNIKAYPKWFKPQWALEPQKGYVFGSILIKKQTFLDIGLLNSNYKVGGDDVDWFAKAKFLEKKELMLPEVLLYRKIHNNNTSKMTKEGNKDLLSVIRAKILREKQY